MELEKLMIYKQYIQLIYYTENILKKYPKFERYGIVTHIRNNTYEGMKYIILCYKENDKKYKLSYLRKLDADLKMLCILIRISKMNKYISNNNFIAWIKKITNITNLMVGWYKCAKA